MPIAIAAIRTRVRTRWAANLATPAYAPIHETSITTWADEAAATIIHKIDPVHLQALHTIDETISLTAGSGNLPSDFERHLAVKCVVGSNNIKAQVYLDPEEFARWDSGNFIMTPTTRKPVALIAGGTLKAKPTSITTAYLDYLKAHPAIASNNTLFDAFGDEVLINLIVAKGYGFLEEYELQAAALKEAGVGV